MPTPHVPPNYIEFVTRDGTPETVEVPAHILPDPIRQRMEDSINLVDTLLRRHIPDADETPWEMGASTNNEPTNIDEHVKITMPDIQVQIEKGTLREKEITLAEEITDEITYQRLHRHPPRTRVLCVGDFIQHNQTVCIISAYRNNGVIVRDIFSTKGWEILTGFENIEILALSYLYTTSITKHSSKMNELALHFESECARKQDMYIIVNNMRGMFMWEHTEKKFLSEFIFDEQLITTCMRGFIDGTWTNSRACKYFKDIISDLKMSTDIPVSAIVSSIIGKSQMIYEQRHRLFRSRLYRTAKQTLIKEITAGNGSRIRTPRKLTTVNVLVGWEVECTSCCALKSIQKMRDLEKDVMQIHDGSVDDDGIEFITNAPHTPVKSMEILDNLFSSYSMEINKSCGFHLHVSIAPNVSNSVTDKLLKSISKRQGKFTNRYVNALYNLALTYEEEIFELVPTSRQSNSFCRKLKTASNSWSKGSIKDKLGSLSNSKYSNDQRYWWLNFVEFYRTQGIRTVEFRLLGNTQRLEYIYAMILLYLILVWGALQLDITNNPGNVELIHGTIKTQITEVKRVQHPENPDAHGDKRREFMKTQLEKIEKIQNAINQTEF